MVNVLTTLDFPIHALGSLKPSSMHTDEEPHLIEGETVINGVTLPLQVIEELRKLGMALSWYNAGELRDAIVATSYDSQLIDDENGVNFRDKLQQTEEEKDADEQSWFSYARMRVRNRKRKSMIQSPNDCQSNSSAKLEDCGIYSM